MSNTAQSSVAKNIGDNLTHDVNALLDLMAGHGTVHPDRGQCGGVGACLMLRTESHETDEIRDTLERIAGSYRLEITATPREKQ